MASARTDQDVERFDIFSDDYDDEDSADDDSPSSSSAASLVDLSLVRVAADAAFGLAKATVHFLSYFPEDECEATVFSRAIGGFVMDPDDVSWADVSLEVGELVFKIGSSLDGQCTAISEANDASDNSSNA